VGIFKSKKKMVAAANHFIFSSAWWTDYFNPRLSTGAIYLRNILNDDFVAQT